MQFMVVKRTEISNRIQYNEGIFSIVLNTLLFGLKLWAGIVSNSLAIKADAWHTLSDSVSSIIVIFAAKVGAKPADKQHPFGHGRAGLIASLFIGFLLFIIAFEFIKGGVLNLRSHNSAQFGTFAIVVTIISIIVKEGMAQYAYWGYRMTRDVSLRADGWHHRSDALSSVVLLIGMFLGDTVWWMDSLLSFIIGGLMIYAAREIVQEGVYSLLGESATDELISDLKKMSNKVLETNVHVHHVHLHKYGHHSEVTFHIILPGELSLKEAHEKVKPLRLKIREKLLIEATIHIDPIKKGIKYLS